MSDEPVVEEALAGETAAPAAAVATAAAPVRKRRRMGSLAQWSRWLHVYTSMISLLVVLFFGVTGLTLNHPTWTFGDDPVHTTYTGTLPAGAISDGNVDFLAITEYIRATYDVSAPVGDYSASDSTGTIGFKGPGYAADLLFDVASSTYTLNVDELGFVAVMNDLHKGRDTSSAWGWVIDISAIFLVLVAITGLVIQLLTRKRRRRALIFAGAFTVVSIILMWSTMA